MVEGLASSLSYFAGWMADRTGKRKALTLAGYGFSTLAKIILPITSSVAGPSAFRVVGRLGKGFWGPPRDAWISAMAEKDSRDTRLACTRRSTRREQFLDHSWRTVCLRCLESGSRLTDTVPDCTRFRITEPRGPEFHQGSTRGSTPAREHVQNLEGSERGIQALPRPRWSLFTGLFQFRHRGPSNWSARHSNDSLVAACTTTLDRQFLPQAPQIWQSQNVVEVRPRAWFRCQATGAGAQIWQDTLPELFDTTSAP